MPRPDVVSVNRDRAHRFSKQAVESVRLLVGLGVEGDAHLGRTVQHLSRVRRDPDQPNMRQVHLIHAELHDELRSAGFDIEAGGIGENVTTRGVDLLALPTGTLLRLGPDAVIEMTGLRNPCTQIEKYRIGMLAEVVGRDANGSVVRRAGVMAIVTVDGVVRPGDSIAIEMPPAPHVPLAPV
ncbi:MAG: MOSC domain-containing protein [Mycobacteriales bacterium]